MRTLCIDGGHIVKKFLRRNTFSCSSQEALWEQLRIANAGRPAVHAEENKKALFVFTI